ncbi:MAG: hypothetical protein U1E54_03790 [Candidatus Levybacteria bacterium]|nr:hypothetical protein [Candidatus Levybacteria bacterium]
MTNKEIKEKFYIQNLHSIWDRIRFWFFVRKVYWQKRVAVWEATLDKMYFETKYLDEIRYNDQADREALAVEHRKPLKEHDQVRIESLEKRISRGKAIKDSYRRNEDFLFDSIKYKQMLDIWFYDKGEN